MFAVPAKICGAAAQSGSEEAARKEERAEELSYEEAINALYLNSGSTTDEQILESVRNISSDTELLYSELTGDECGNAERALSSYEEAKADYLTSAINSAADGSGLSAAPEEDAVCREWDRQVQYAQMMIAENSVIREMIPRYQVTSCTKKGEFLELGVDEWMTQGYSLSPHAETVNASAYSYTFTLTLKCSAGASWMPAEINGTDINYAWLGEGGELVTESQEPPSSLFEVKSDLDTAAVAYAQLGSDESVSGAEIEEAGSGPALSYEIDEDAAVPSESVQRAAAAQDLTADTGYTHKAELYTTASGTYVYKPASAVAYADRYWKKYNRSYKEYKGVDCANFVSQCLYAGGMPRTSDWYPRSVNWINVTGHIRHFKSYGTFLTASNANVTAGNPVYYDWNGNGTYDHVGICVGRNASGMPVVDAHTNNVYHVPWSMGSRGRRATIVLRRTNTSSASTSGAKNVWQTINGKVYYIGSDGRHVKNKFLTIGGGRYYFNSGGVRVTGFFKVGSKWYYASVKNGRLLKGWQNIGGKVYYFSVKDYSRMTAGMHRIGSATYYFNSKGVRQTSFIKVGSKWYYADKKTGKFVKGWKKISGEWYYFDRKTMVKATGWKTIDGKRCYFDSHGILKKGKHG